MNPPRLLVKRFVWIGRLLGIGGVLAYSGSVGSAQSLEEEVRALRLENAALRQRIVELETSPESALVPPGMTAAVPESDPVPGGMRPADEVRRLRPFEVTTDQDSGYLQTNSATATRVGIPVQRIPLAISILGEDFIADTGLREIQDVLRYVPSSAGDTRLAIKPPGNSATPSGSFTLRGFPVSSRLRDGVGRFSYYNLDTVDRIEVIRGPAAVFFGQGFPGGVINYITKQPQFAELPTTISFGIGGNAQRFGTQRVTLDHNTVLSDQVAARFISAWDDAVGTQRFEFRRAFTVAPSVTLVPLDSGRLRLKAGLEYAQSRQNTASQGWMYPAQWFADYEAPPAALIAAGGVADADAYRARIFNNVGLWIADVRRTNQGNELPANFDADNRYVPGAALWTSVERGAYYNRLDGTRSYDPLFNNRGPGNRIDQTDTAITFSVEADPTDWLSARYTFTKNDSTYGVLTSHATPYADGDRFNLTGLTERRDERESLNHQVDFVLHQDWAGVKHKLLFGGLYDQSRYSYRGASGFLFTNLPGVALPASGVPATIVSSSGDPLFPPLTSVIINNGNAPGGQTAAQQVYNRDGRALTPAEIFQQYDPALQPAPDIRRITPIERSLIDRYHPQREEYYVNYMGALLDDRLNLFAGFRTVNEYNGDERPSANPPWYVGFEDMGAVLSPAEQLANGISTAPGSYYLGTLAPKRGESSMFGASYALTGGVTLYASHSTTYLPNSGFLGLADENQVRLKAASLGLDPDAEIGRIRAGGSNQPLRNEMGRNDEIGVKTSLWDQRLVGTLSLFRLLRTNEKLDDTQRQIDEPLNYSAPNRGGTYSTTNGGVRWYSNSAVRKVEGLEAEIIWTPSRHYQLLANGSWLWTARTVADPRIFDPEHPPDGATPVQIRANNQNHYFTYGFRMPNVPEFRFNVFNKYTFAEGRLRGLSLTLGARYASVMNIANDINTDSSQGGVTAGDYLVLDGGLSYPWRLGDFDFNTSLQISNLTDADYNEGSGGLAGAGFELSPPLTWFLSNTLRF